MYGYPPKSRGFHWNPPLSVKSPRGDFRDSIRILIDLALSPRGGRPRARARPGPRAGGLGGGEGWFFTVPLIGGEERKMEMPGLEPGTQKVHPSLLVNLPFYQWGQNLYILVYNNRMKKICKCFWFFFVGVVQSILFLNSKFYWLREQYLFKFQIDQCRGWSSYFAINNRNGKITIT